MKKIAVIDNYDSFTYNIVEMMRSDATEISVFRNDEFEMHQLESFDRLVLSPGPGLPKQAGKLMQVLETFSHRKSILGICLGHQAIGEFFGAQLINTQQVFHGKQSEIQLKDQNRITKTIPENILVGRYHSWVIDKDVPKELVVTATTFDGTIMGIRHQQFDVHGLQFHPESILTPHGKRFLQNFIEEL